MNKAPIAFLVTLFAAALAAGCDARSLDVKTTGAGGGDGGIIGGGGGGGPADGGTFVPVRKVDILFVVDDSAETRLMQDTLVRNFPVFMNRLMDPPGLPDLHIAVISTDMGAGDGTIAGCDATGGKNGIFQYQARGACTTTGLAPGATFIADDGTNRNYTGSLSDVFGCIAALGESGCGFEHQLAAITRALGADGSPAPAENQGFLRPDAFLMILVLTNEDDCSAPAGSNFYDTSMNTTLGSYLGPPLNFRCNEFGHLCNGMKPPRLAPNGDVAATVTLDGCVSAEGSGMLTPVATIVSQLRALKPFPDRQIVVTAIAGPPTPYQVAWSPPGSADTGPWPLIEYSCIAPDGSFADPAVRLAQWVSAFGPNGLFMSVCQDNFGPSLDRMAMLLNQAMAPR
jgi:hypothetical protein